MAIPDRALLLLLVAVCCTASPAAAVEQLPWFHWGPRDYPLDDVFISVRWSLPCLGAGFNIEEVSVRGDGEVEIIRPSGKRCPGDSRRLYRGTVLHLISEFYSLGFFAMEDEYPGRFWVEVTDDGIVSPRGLSDAFSCYTVVTFAAGDYSKTVESWGAAPPSFDDLARAVAEAALFGAPVTESESEE